MAEPARATSRPARILIVDDEPLSADYLEQELESLGFITETAVDGLEALERVAASPPDLVLLDVMMPRMDGISTLRVLKSDPETRLIPVVLMTALNSVEDRVRGIEAGADDFLSRPVDERELLARIRAALELKRAIDEKVGELRSTSAHLARYGRQERHVAVLVAEWRGGEEDLPAEVVGFVARRHRTAAIERIRTGGGIPSEREAGLLVAAFDGPDLATRTGAALEAALAILAAADAESPPILTSLAVTAGRAEVGSVRLRQEDEQRWVYAVEGEPVRRATALARGAAGAAVLIAGDAAGAVTDGFSLQATDGGAYHVVAPIPGATGDTPPAPDRRITTTVVTDIVGSTRILERVGDRAWRELIAAHEETTRNELACWGGEEINTTGDGFIVSFESPTRAVEYALSLRQRLAALGLRIRAGVHTGEVERMQGRVHGIALNVASRIAARANPAEVLVSATARDLAAGSQLAFSDRGEHLLEGVREPRRLYAAAEPPDAAPARNLVGGAATDLPVNLTPRELDVLRLVALGLSDAEAAARLFVSVRTVHAHLRSIYRKTGVHSRAAAGRFAADNGLL